MEQLQFQSISVFQLLTFFLQPDGTSCCDFHETKASYYYAYGNDWSFSFGLAVNYVLGGGGGGKLEERIVLYIVWMNSNGYAGEAVSSW
jgi:hypothetical protein